MYSKSQNEHNTITSFELFLDIARSWSDHKFEKYGFFSSTCKTEESSGNHPEVHYC